MSSVKKDKFGINSHYAAQKALHEAAQAHYVVKDWNTGQEHGFETEAEAHTAQVTWAEAARSAYRYTIYKVPGRF